MIDHFDGISTKYYDFVDRVWYDAGYFHERELDISKSFAEGVREDPILDAGCGPGRHTEALLARGRRVVALDFSLGMLQQVRDRFRASRGARVDLVRADVRALPFRTGAFSGVVSVEVVEHLPDDAASVAALKEVRRCVRNRGRALVEVPLRGHAILVRLLRKRPSWKELTDEERRKYYEEHPLLYGRFHSSSHCAKTPCSGGSDHNRSGLRAGNSFRLD